MHFIRSIKPKERKSNSVSIIKTLQDKRIDLSQKTVFYFSGTIEISGFINGIDIVAEDKLFKISDYIREGKDRPKSQVILRLF
jgi:lipoprotein-releasing system permease protein